MPQTSTPTISINDFTKTYGGDVPAVKNISVEVHQGEIFGFLGPNGAGKSTTIRAILNFISPSTGSISVNGMDSVRDSIKIKKNIGYLAGDIALYGDMTGRQLFAHLSALDAGVDIDYVDELVETLDVNPGVKIRSLSKGNKQKIGLIQVFMHKPDILILDEPTSGLDPLMKEIFYRLARDLRNQGRTIFLSSHDLTEVQKICDRVAFIRNGEIAGVEDIQNAGAMKYRRYLVTFESQPPETELSNLRGVDDVQMKNEGVLCTVTGSVDEFIKALAVYNVVDLDEQETSLEDVFMHYYEGEDSV